MELIEGSTSVQCAPDELRCYFHFCRRKEITTLPRLRYYQLEETPMPLDLTVPFAMAAVFTGGAITIKRLERRADRVERVLIGLFMICVALCVVGVMRIAIDFCTQCRATRSADRDTYLINNEEFDRLIDAGYD